MVLYLIGIGLDEKDISLRALEIIKKCKLVYLDYYTSFGINIRDLEILTKKKIIKADRELLENKSNGLIEKARKENIAVLAYGDCLSATTHISLLQECEKLKVKYEIIHGVSIFTAIGETGLNLYNFGKIASIPFENKNVKVPYEILKNNQSLGMHTLFLLDLNSGGEKFMTIREGIEYLLDIGLFKEQLIVGCARLGRRDRFIKFGTAEKLKDIDFGKPPCCFIIPEKLHFVEEEFLEKFKIK